MRQPLLAFGQWLRTRRGIAFGVLVLANLGVFAVFAARPPPAPAPAPRLELAGEQPLVLVKEMAHVEPRRAPEQAQPEVAGSPQCRVWGPVTDRTALDALAGMVRAQGGDPQIEESVIQGEPDYLVYLEAIVSPTRAQSIARELNELGIEAVALNGTESISVGVFSSETRALAQQTRLENLGFPVLLKPLPRDKTIYNLRGFARPGTDVFAQSNSPCLAIAQGG